MDQIIRNTFEIAAGILTIAGVALLINKSSNTAQVIGAAGSTFDNLLRTVTLQNSGYNY